MTEDIEITFARRLGEVLGEMRATLGQKEIRRILTFILQRHGIDVINNTFYVEEPPKKTISVQAVSTPPALQENIVLKTTPIKTFDVVMEVAEPKPTVSCPICQQNGIRDQRGLGGHMWGKHHVRKTEYDAKVSEP